MLDLCSDTDLGIGKPMASDFVASSPDTGVVVLKRDYIPAIAEKSGFMDGLGKGDIRADSFGEGFLPIIIH